MFQDPFILSVLLALAAVTGVFFGVPRLRRSGCAATTGMKVPARARSHARPETRRNDLLFLLHASVPDSARHSLSMLLPLCRSREINVFSGFSKLFSNIFRKSFEKSD